MFTRSCKFTSFTRQHELEKEFKEPVELDETIVYGKNNIKSCRQEGFDTIPKFPFSYSINLTTIYLSSIVIFIIDTLITAHLEEFGKIGLRYAQVYVVNHEELRVVFHIVGVR